MACNGCDQCLEMRIKCCWEDVDIDMGTTANDGPAYAILTNKHGERFTQGVLIQDATFNIILTIIDAHANPPSQYSGDLLLEVSSNPYGSAEMWFARDGVEYTCAILKLEVQSNNQV